MNEDQLRSMLHRTAQTGVTDDGAPDVARITRRVRGVRRRRTLTGVLGGVASVVLVAVVVWQVGGLDPDPAPPATPTSTVTTGDPTPTDETTPTEQPTAPTETPSETAVETPSTDPGAVAVDWSDAVFPQCGDSGFELPDRSSQLVVRSGPDGPVGVGSPWTTQIENTGDTTIAGGVGLSQAVVLDGDGVVVAIPDMEDPAFWGAEGGIDLHVEGGASLPFRVAAAQSCAGGPLPAGEYQVYVLATVAVGGDDDTLEQAQGGPFALVVDDSTPDYGMPVLVPEGAVDFSWECGTSWQPPAVETGFELELIDPIRTPRAVDDDISGASRLTMSGALVGAVYDDVVIAQDGRIVGIPLSTDAVNDSYLSGDVELDLTFGAAFTGCADYEPLPSGSYEVTVITVLGGYTSEGMVYSIIAATEPVDVTLE